MIILLSVLDTFGTRSIFEATTAEFKIAMSLKSNRQIK